MIGTITFPAQPKQYATRNVVVLSTGHLSGATINLLDVTPLDKWPCAGGPIPYGYYIWAPEDANEDRETPDDLTKVLLWARSKGFDYVQFDADEEMIDDLPTFDHADVWSPAQLAAARADRDGETITELRREREFLMSEIQRLRLASAQKA